MSDPTISKVLGRLEVTGEVGTKLDAQLDAATTEAHEQAGAKKAFAFASKKVLELGAHAKREFEEGGFDNIDPAAVHAKVLDYLRQASTVCDNLQNLAASKELIANGKAKALTDAVDVVQRYHTSARSRYDQLTATPEDHQDGDTEGLQEDAPDSPTRIRGAGRTPYAERKQAE